MRTPEPRYVCAVCGKPKAKRAYNELATVCNECRTGERERKAAARRKLRRKAKRDKLSAAGLKRPSGPYDAAQRRASKHWKACAKALLAERKAQPCWDCHQSFPPRVMHFYPVRGSHLVSVAKIARSAVWWKERYERLEEAVNNCVVLCANCREMRKSGTGLSRNVEQRQASLAMANSTRLLQPVPMRMPASGYQAPVMPLPLPPVEEES